MSAKPREVSSNDAQLDPESEYSSQCQPMQEKRKQQRQHTKYQCPADFVFCNFRPCASTRLESVNDGNRELWLIKAPVTFSPDSFSGIRVPMMGLETIQPHTGHQQVYSILSRPVAVGNSRLLTTDGQQPGDALCAPAFSGIINICESYGDCLGNQTPVAIPACPAPLIPEGLKQRFQPFGSRTPSSQGSKVREQQEDEHTDCPTAAKRVRIHPEDSKTPKKKKKKDKRIKMEQEEMVEDEVLAAVSHSLMETSQEPAPGEEAVEKKKKKKKDKRSKIEQEQMVEEQVLAVVSHGLMETSQDPALGEEAMEKKKKKKDKRIKMEQEEIVEEEVLAAVSYGLTETSQEPASGQEALKKRKKKKDKRIKMEQEEMVEEQVLAVVSHGLMETSQEPAPGEEAMKKKRKKSKDTDRREMEEGSRGVEMALRLKQEVVVKTEPLDFACSDMGSFMKKKKKLKKEKSQD